MKIIIGLNFEKYFYSIFHGIYNNFLFIFRKFKNYQNNQKEMQKSMDTSASGFFNGF